MLHHSNRARPASKAATSSDGPADANEFSGADEFYNNASEFYNAVEFNGAIRFHYAAEASSREFQCAAPPPPPPPDQTGPAAQTGAQKTAQPGSDAPLPQQDTPNVKAGSKQDVNAIGDRNVGKGGIDFYSIEHEIALGKSLAQEVERPRSWWTIPSSSST